MPVDEQEQEVLLPPKFTQSVRIQWSKNIKDAQFVTRVVPLEDKRVPPMMIKTLTRDGRRTRQRETSLDAWSDYSLRLENHGDHAIELALSSDVMGGVRAQQGTLLEALDSDETQMESREMRTFMAYEAIAILFLLSTVIALAVLIVKRVARIMRGKKEVEAAAGECDQRKYRIMDDLASPFA